MLFYVIVLCFLENQRQSPKILGNPKNYFLSNYDLKHQGFSYFCIALLIPTPVPYEYLLER